MAQSSQGYRVSAFYLVLKVLCCHQWIFPPVSLSQLRLDLATSTSTLGVKIERLPELVDAVISRLCSCIYQYTDIWFQCWSKCLEKPTVRIDLLLVVFFQTEEHLHGDSECTGHCCYFISIATDANLRCVLEFHPSQ